MKLYIIISKLLYIMYPSTAIRILYRKIPLKNHVSIDEIIQMSNELTKTARKANGFISSNSFWEKDINNSLYLDKSLYTFSDWENINHWNNWLNSSDRENVIKKYNINFESKITILTNKIDPFVSIPLL